MAPRIGYDNFCRRAEAPATASAGSSGIGTPASRVLSADLSEVWRSAPGVGETWLRIDLDGPEEIDTVVLVGNFRPTTNWKVRIGTGDLTNPANVTHDTGMGAAGIVEPWGIAALMLNTPVVGESILFNLQDDAVDIGDPSFNALEVSRPWVTKAFRPERWYSFGYEQGAVDYSVVSRTPYGAVFVEERPITRTYRLTFEVMTGQDRDEADRMLRLCGSSREILLCLNEESPQLGRDTLLAIPRGQPIAHRFPKVWSWTLDCEERI